MNAAYESYLHLCKEKGLTPTPIDKLLPVEPISAAKEEFVYVSVKRPAPLPSPKAEPVKEQTKRAPIVKKPAAKKTEKPVTEHGTADRRAYYRAQYYLKKEKVKAYQKQRYIDKKEAIDKRNREWARANTEAVNAANRRYRAKRKNTADLTPEEREAQAMRVREYREKYPERVKATEAKAREKLRNNPIKLKIKNKNQQARYLESIKCPIKREKLLEKRARREAAQP